MNIYNAGGRGGGISKIPALSETQSLRWLLAAGLIWPGVKLQHAVVHAAPPRGGRKQSPQPDSIAANITASLTFQEANPGPL